MEWEGERNDRVRFDWTATLVGYQIYEEALICLMEL